jgi:hypothetical protein
VTSNGLKTFYFVYRFQGRSRRMTLGRYPATHLKDAVGKAREALRSLVKGEDRGHPAHRARQRVGRVPRQSGESPTAVSRRASANSSRCSTRIATIGEAVGKPRADAECMLGLAQHGGVALGGDAKHFVWTTNCYSTPTTCGTPPIQLSQV